MSLNNESGMSNSLSQVPDNPTSTLSLLVSTCKQCNIDIPFGRVFCSQVCSIKCPITVFDEKHIYTDMLSQKVVNI